MKTKIAILYETLRASYWFIPAVMAFLAMVLAMLLVYFDLYNERQKLIDLSWISLTGAAGARAILSTVASSMITVTGIVFSITIVTLSLASQQFGPRLLQNFMRDRGNQLVLGTVTSTYLYCLLVLRTVNDGRSTSFIPHLSILAAMLLAVLCVGVLIYFVHHVAESIQVTNVIAAISRDLSANIERFFPDRFDVSSVAPAIGRTTLKTLLPERFDEQVRAVPALGSGYLQAVDHAGLLELAEERNLIICIKHRIGQFVVAGTALVEIWSQDAEDVEKLVPAVNGHFITGPKRSQEQDPEFLINELVEIASRALSPGINDPFTAISCTSHLGISLCEMAQRVFPPAARAGRTNRVRLITNPVTFEQMVDTAFNQIRQYGRSHTAVTVCLLETIRVIIPFTHHPEQREALLRQAAMIERGSHEGLPEEADRQAVHDSYLAVFQTVEECFGMTGGA